MSLPSPRDRSYSAPPSTHNVAAMYGWSQAFVQTGGANPVTGNFIPAQLDADGKLQVNVGGLSFSGDLNAQSEVYITGQSIPLNVTGQINSGNYGANFLSITGSQSQIPAGAWSWGVYVESGFGFVNGLLCNTFTSLQGGGYDGQKRLSSAINVGTTGSAATPCRMLVNWEA